LNSVSIHSAVYGVRGSICNILACWVSVSILACLGLSIPCEAHRAVNRAGGMGIFGAGASRLHRGVVG